MHTVYMSSCFGIKATRYIDQNVVHQYHFYSMSPSLDSMLKIPVSLDKTNPWRPLMVVDLVSTPLSFESRANAINMCIWVSFRLLIYDHNRFHV